MNILSADCHTRHIWIWWHPHDGHSFLHFSRERYDSLPKGQRTTIFPPGVPVCVARICYLKFLCGLAGPIEQKHERFWRWSTHAQATYKINVPDILQLCPSLLFPSFTTSTWLAQLQQNLTCGSSALHIIFPSAVTLVTWLWISLKCLKSLRNTVVHHLDSDLVYIFFFSKSTINQTHHWIHYSVSFLIHPQFSNDGSNLLISDSFKAFTDWKWS